MALLSSLIFFVLIVQISNQDKCDLNCYFEEYTITSKTLKKWPKTCGTVCGNLIIDSSCDVSDSQLVDQIWRLDTLRGTIRISNSNITHLMFLINLKSFVCDEEGFLISNNSELSTAEGVVFKSETPCLFRVTNNPKLNLTHLTMFTAARITYGNLEDPSSCIAPYITPDSLPNYKNCTSILGGELTITNVPDSVDLSVFKKLKSIEDGSVHIFKTQLTNLSFLSNLTQIIGGLRMSFDGVHHLRISDNPNLKMLGWGSLTHLSPSPDQFYVHISGNHPDFCLTVHENKIFYDYRAVFLNGSDFPLCPDSLKPGNIECNFWNLEYLGVNCQHLNGTVLVDETNEKFAWRLGNVSHIRGSLTIRDTEELVDLSFLANLETMIKSKKDERNAIRILSNKKLKNVVLHKMKTPPFPYDPEEDFIQIDGNSLEIFKNRKECLLIKAITRTNVKYNDKSCTKLPKAPGGTHEFGKLGDIYKEDSAEDDNEEDPAKGGGKKSSGILKNYAIFVVFILFKF